MKEGLYLHQVSFWTTSPLLMSWSDGDMTWCWHRPRCCLWLWSQFIHFQSLSDSPLLPQASLPLLTGGGCGGRWPLETQTPASPESQFSVSSPDEDAAEDTSPHSPHPQTRPPYSAHTGTRLLSLATCSEQTPSYLEEALPFKQNVYLFMESV